LDGLKNVTLNARGAVFSGGVCALKLTNFQNVTINGGEFTRAGYGLMLQDGNGATVVDSRALDNQTTGFLVANCERVSFRRCEGSRSKTQWGFYGSQSSDHLEFVDCTANGNFRGAIQVNANDPRRGSDPAHDSLSEDVTISGGHFDGNQQQGGSTINFAGVRGAKVVDSSLTNCGGRSLLALWDDGMGSRFGCVDVTVDRITGSFAGGNGKALVSSKYTPKDQLKVGAITVPGWKGTVIEWQ
jgi:hypothetical protein